MRISRRYLTILLSSILLVAGILRSQFFIVIQEMKQKAELHELFEKRLKSGEIGGDPQKMSFSAEEWHGLRKPNDHEVVVNGVFYDILSCRSIDGRIEVSVISDETEKKLEELWTKKQSDSKKDTHALVKLPKLVYLTMPLYIAILSSDERTAYTPPVADDCCSAAFLSGLLKPPAFVFV